MKKYCFLLLFLFLFQIVNAQPAWYIAGNTALQVTPTSVLGTLTTVPLNFVVNSQPSGNIDFDPAIANTSLGYQTLFSNTSTGLTAVGYQALSSNTNGTGNFAAGFQSLFANTTGSRNTATGYLALTTNIAGKNNTAHGYQALQNSTGDKIPPLVKERLK